MTVVGTIGEGKLLVLHPAFRGVPAAMAFGFGIQRTIARRLKKCGRPTMFAVFRTRVEHVEYAGEGPPPLEVGQIGLGVADAWPDDTVAQLLVRQFACRWGVVLDMSAEDTRTRLVTRLFEADESGARVIEAREFDDVNVELPAEVFAIVHEVARKTGVRCAWAGWDEMFETSDVIAALLGLRMTGILSGVEEGVVYEREALLGELREVLHRAPDSGWVIDLVGEVLRGLHRQGVSPMHLVGWLRRAQKVAGADAWPGLEDELAQVHAS